MGEVQKIVWTNTAKDQLKTIYNITKKNLFKEQIM